MTEKLKNGLELTTTFQLATELMDQYPVKGIIKRKAKDFLKAARISRHNWKVSEIFLIEKMK